MKSAVIKRSIVIRGHKTSVSLENEFWEELKDFARRKSATLSTLVEGIDDDRNKNNLSSAIRVYVLREYRTRLNGQNFESNNARTENYTLPLLNASDVRVKARQL